MLCTLLHMEIHLPAKHHSSFASSFLFCYNTSFWEQLVPITSQHSADSFSLTTDLEQGWHLRSDPCHIRVICIKYMTLRGETRRILDQDLFQSMLTVIHFAKKKRL